MDFLTIRSGCPSIRERTIEIVERKGLGHPDTLADGIAESISIEYSQYCLQRFGAVLHHNVDKTAIIGGQFVSSFGTSKMVAPVRIICNGRMSTSFGGEAIDVKAIQELATKRYLKRVLPELDPTQHVQFEHYTSDYSRYGTWFRPRSYEDLPELTDLRASDTSIVVGFWPMTPTEKLVLALERYLNTPEEPRRYSFLGQDIKVLAYRNETDVHVTMCVPFLSRQTPDANFYDERKREVLDDLLTIASREAGPQLKVKLDINTQERSAFEAKKFYLLATGSCIECGEEGVVGRGNSPAGVISVHRPHPMEAAYGKNPVYHSGKVYSHLVTKLATAIATQFSCECTVYAICRNGEQLIPPTNLIIETNAGPLERSQVEDLIEEHLLEEDYLTAIVNSQVLLPR
jgi:S-adenosylmethionine synthetase